MDKLTMQLLADALGVDRETLNYHVSDRDSLLQLVAAKVFAESMAELDVGGSGTWQQSVRFYAHGVRAAVLHLGPRARHFRLHLATVIPTLAPADDLIRVLLDSGFAENGGALPAVGLLPGGGIGPGILAGRRRRRRGRSC